jgi:hypothetical protein
VKVRNDRLVLSFVGKKIVDQYLETRNPVLVRYAPPAVAAGADTWLGIDDYRLRKFVKRYVGKAFTPRDLRRAYVNILFCGFFQDDYEDDFKWQTKKSDRNKVVRKCIEDVASTVGHTPGVCRSAYLSHPMLNVLKTWTPS